MSIKCERYVIHTNARDIFEYDSYQENKYVLSKKGLERK